MNRIKAIRPSPFILDVFFTTITSVLVTISAVLVTRLLADGLGPEKFAAYSLSRRILSTISPFTLLGMDLAVTRCVAIAESARARRSFLLSALLLGGGACLAILAIGLTFRTLLASWAYGDKAYAPLFTATLLLVVTYTFYVILYALYRGSGRMSYANLWQIAVYGVGPLAVAAVVARSGSVELIVLLLAGLFSFALIPLVYQISLSLRDRPSRQESITSARELLEYGLPRVPAGMILAGLLALGQFLAPHVGNLQDAGYLAAGQAVLVLVEGGVMAFGLVVLPKLAQVASTGQRAFLRESISHVMAFTLHVGLFIMIQLMFWTDQLVLVLLGTKYLAAIPIMRIILLALVPYLAYVLLRSVVDAVEKKAINTRNLLWAFIGTALFMAISVALKWGSLGLSMGTAWGVDLLGFLTVRYLWKSFQLDWRALNVFPALLVNLVLALLALAFKVTAAPLLKGWPLIAAIGALEGVLALIFAFVLWKLRVSWLHELQQRVVRVPANNNDR